MNDSTHDHDEPTRSPEDPITPPPRGEEDIPDWLKRIRAKREAEEATRRQRELDLEILRATSQGANPPQGDTLTPPPEPPAESAPVKLPTPQEHIPAPSAASVPAPDTPPDWVQALEAGENAADDGHDIPAPSWLRNVMDAEAAPLPVPPAPEPVPPTAEAGATADSGPTLRQRRARRRAQNQKSRGGSLWGGVLQSLALVGAAAALIATIFTFWTPANFLSEQAREGLRPAYATLSAQSPPTPVPTPLWMRRIGVVSGHWGPYPGTGRSDPGAVCPDGLTEAEVNRNVATLVVQQLSGMGFDVDLLDEWDPRLDGYQASVLISIHSDSCHQFDLPGATGFKVAPPSSRTTVRADDERLHDCLVEQYATITGMPIHPSLTRDMTEYHSFQEIDAVTPANIIELGFLYEDREMLEDHPDTLASGIVAGIMCFMNNAPPTPLPELTPWPTIEATPTPLDTPGPS